MKETKAEGVKAWCHLREGEQLEEGEHRRGVGSEGAVLSAAEMGDFE